MLRLVEPSLEVRGGRNSEQKLCAQWCCCVLVQVRADSEEDICFQVELVLWIEPVQGRSADADVRFM